MQCPFCAEQMKDEAILCKHCHQIVIIPKPLIKQNNEQAQKIVELETELDGVRAELSNWTRAHSDSIGTLRFHHITRYLLLPLATLILAHYLLIIKYDLHPIYLRYASMVIPIPVGFALFRREGYGFGPAFLIGAFIAIFSVAAMNVIVGLVDGKSILPSTVRGWQESGEYMISIALAVVAGNMLAQLHANARRSSLQWRQSAAFIDNWLAPMIGANADDGSLSGRLETIEKSLKIAGLVASLAGSIYTGVRGVLS